ncbi:hypothetical protein RHSIM_Rhsim12G0125900 [Rhododendron simsii]|uniref:Uncharacterized protein n=1 Tax=Rhododendron simsii TaxID=118357 RepID=A0A834LA72_RHOSS|nr:hypothetical protein RHSIM_Rhsim12G0125900 [Rhododendron simsii]
MKQSPPSSVILNLASDAYIRGKVNFIVLPSRSVTCLSYGCEIWINIIGNFSLDENATVLAGTFELEAYNVSFCNESAVNATGLDGSPPAQTSGTSQGWTGWVGAEGLLCD